MSILVFVNATFESFETAKPLAVSELHPEVAAADRRLQLSAKAQARNG